MSKIIIALDCDIEKAKEVVKKVDKKVNFFKVGPVMFFKYHREIIDFLSARGKKVFLDLKLFDIPNTIKYAIENLKDFNVYSLSIHLLAGPEIIKTAVKTAGGKIKVWGVSILTSVDYIEYAKIGFRYSMENQILRLARMGKDCGIDGIISSPQDLKYLRSKISGVDFITPSIRLAGSGAGDQKRYLTPYLAAKYGCDYLVIGRPVIEASDPLSVVEKILYEVEKKDGNGE